MNLGYIEKNDKVLVIDENGNETERENTEYIYDILSYENSLEKINGEIKYYLDKRAVEELNLCVASTSKKIGIIMGITAFIVSNMIFLARGGLNYLVEFLLDSFCGFSLIPIIASAIGKYNKKKINKRINKIDYILEALKQEEKYLKNKLEEIETKSKEIDKENTDKMDDKKINYRKMDEEFDIALDNRIKIIERQAEQLPINNKSKTLKRVRK